MGYHQKDQFMNNWRATRRRKGWGKESLLKEIMAKNFQILGKDLDIQVHEVHRLPNKIKLKRYF